MYPGILKQLLQFMQEDSPEKLLIVPSRTVGNLLLKGYADVYGGVLGLRVETPLSLARELCARQGCARPILSDHQCALLVLNLLKRYLDDPDHPLQYFSQLDKQVLSLSTAQSLLKVFFLLEEFELSDLYCLTRNNPRISDINFLFLAYQREKKSLKVWDRFDVFKHAPRLEPGVSAVICSNVYGRGIVRNFLYRILVLNSLRLISVPTIGPVEEISQRFLSSTTVPLPSAALSFSKGFSPEREAAAPLHTILDQSYPLGDTAIFCADPSLIPLLADAAAQLKLPVTLEHGLPLSSSPLVGMLRQLQSWYDRGCPLNELAGLVSAGLLLPDAAALVSKLNQAGVYRSCPHICKALCHSPNPLDFFHTLDQLCGNRLSPASGFSTLISFTKQYYVGENFFRSRQLEALQTLGNQLLPWWEGTSFRPFLAHLLEQSKSASFLSSVEKDGAIHVSSLENAAFCQRPHRFLIGLSRDILYPTPQESPLLRDDERRRLGLPLSDEDSALHRIQLLDALAGLDEHCSAVLSYCCFNPQKNIELPPAPLFTRLSGGKATVFDYFPKTGYLSREHWLQTGANPKTLSSPPCHPCSPIDWTDTTHGIITPSILDQAVQCPLWFYFFHILGIPIPKSSPDPSRYWLSPQAQNSLVRRILSDYFTAVLNGDSPNPDDCCSQILDRARDQLEPAAPALMCRDEQAIRSMVSFAVNFISSQEKLTPLAVRLDFGDPNGEHNRIKGNPEPLPDQFSLTLGKYTIPLAGLIDQLDQMPDGKLCITNYYIESAAGIAQMHYSKISHYLYAHALKEMGSGLTISKVFYLSLSGNINCLFSYSNCAANTNPAYKTQLIALFDLLSAQNLQNMAQPSWDGTNYHCNTNDPLRKKRLQLCRRICPYTSICKEIIHDS